jgi:uroporphyrinogen-III synthase
LTHSPAILVTRPEPGGAETATRLAALGHRPVLAPALVLTPRPFDLPPAQALLLTSRAAARALPPPVAGLPILAVGAATAEAARERGWPDVTAAAGTAADLAELATRRLAPAAGPLLLVWGRAIPLISQPISAPRLPRDAPHRLCRSAGPLPPARGGRDPATW